MQKCNYCGYEKKQGDYGIWFSSEYCSRSCAMNKADELKRKYREVVRLLRENK